MGHCILLDNRQKDDFYVLSYAGSLADCRDLEYDPGTSWSLPKSEWASSHVEDKSLLGPYGHAFPGEIAILEPIVDAGGQP